MQCKTDVQMYKGEMQMCNKNVQKFADVQQKCVQMKKPLLNTIFAMMIQIICALRVYYVTKAFISLQQYM